MDLVSLLTSTTSKGNPNAWDISKAYYDAGADAWNIGKAFYPTIFFSVTGQETGPTALFFKPDGTKMYVLGTTGEDVNEYTLSTPWLVSSASYVQNFSVAAQDLGSTGLFFKPDGTKMYMVGVIGDNVYEYNLSSAWNISTASYLQSFSVATEETVPTGLFFKPDGTKMYITGQTGDDVNEYNLSTPWNISSASYLQNFSVATQETGPSDLFFKSDGTKMYIIGDIGDDINEYSLSTPWDISTASYVQNFSIASQETAPTGLFFHPDGSGFYMTGTAQGRVYQYIIGGFFVGTQETTPQGLSFKPDGTKMYVIGTTGDDVNEYDLSTPWDPSTATYVQVKSVSAQETSPQGLYFRPDGLKMYICGNAGVEVNEYTLSSAWDVSTATFVQAFSTVAQETNPRGLFFKPDGLKMYVAGTTGIDVNEYNLSSAWDISTATYLQNFSVSSQDTLPRNIFFKPDGTKMYVLGGTDKDVNEYTLSSAWDISTASYTQNFSIIEFDSFPAGLYFKPDGTQFFTLGGGTDRVFSFVISPE